MNKEEFEKLQTKAEAGDAVALWKVGEVYRHGDRKLGVVRDKKKGWELIERAAAAKSVVAAYLIGRKDIKFSPLRIRPLLHSSVSVRNPSLF